MTRLTLSTLNRVLVTASLIAAPSLAEPVFAESTVVRPGEMTTRTVNDVADKRSRAYALTGGVITIEANDVRDNSTLLIKDGVIEGVLEGGDVPDGYQEIEMDGKFIYPGLIDYYTQYGMPKAGERVPRSRSAPETLAAKSKRATNSNDAIKSHNNAVALFKPHYKSAEKLRANGIAAVASFNEDGIARGTAMSVLTDGGLANESILSPQVATHYSFNKGSSRQDIPLSRMGVVALLRQTYLDAEWYAAQSPRPFADVSLEAWSDNRDLPKVMTAFDWKTLLLADKIGDEFGDQYIIKGGGDEFERLGEIKATKATIIVDVNYPSAPDIEDPLSASRVTLRELKQWELAPYNLARMSEAAIPFVVTSHDADGKFWKNLRLAVKYGLPEAAALNALTITPATLMNEQDRLGTLEHGKIANLVVSDGPLFAEKTRLLETWVKGTKFTIVAESQLEPGHYDLTIADQPLAVDISQKKKGFGVRIVTESEEKQTMEVQADGDYLTGKLTQAAGITRLSGWLKEGVWQGRATLADGRAADFTLQLSQKPSDETEEADQKKDEESAEDQSPGSLLYPLTAYGMASEPTQEHILIKDATVWTNEAEGILQEADVLINRGKIQKVGKDVSASGATVIDGRGLHITPGIIDEHSHIALDSVNEFATNSTMVRMADVVDPIDVNIYRNLSGGVTAAQLLHGSANPMGGQSALVKMRWGQTPSGMLIEDADKFVKFALGENVKRSTNARSIRFPQTRMGVEQAFVDAFTEARRYEAGWQTYNKLSARDKKRSLKPRRDLRMEATLEVLNGERFVTSHSYVQSEINMLMHVAEQFDFRINTFTHILEGYKVADKMAAHGVGASTFSDWWAYKWEVRYAIPYNAALMHEAGVTVAINSDDPEMSRRLNHEAAKSIRHGGMSEEDALKMVTLNPAKLLHLDDRMGSLTKGKDADLVVWSDHPLSVYSKAMMTFVDGKRYFDREQNEQRRVDIEQERNRLIQKVLRKRESGSKKDVSKSREEKLDYHHDQLELSHD